MVSDHRRPRPHVPPEELSLQGVDRHVFRDSLYPIYLGTVVSFQRQTERSRPALSASADDQMLPIIFLIYIYTLLCY